MSLHDLSNSCIPAGEISWASSTLANNYENQATYTLSVAAYTTGQTDPTPTDIIVTVNNTNEPPIITNLPQVVSMTNENNSKNELFSVQNFLKSIK